MTCRNTTLPPGYSGWSIKTASSCSKPKSISSGASKKKLFREDIDVDILARLRMAEVEMGFNSDIFPAAQFDLQKVQIALLEHFTLGLATLKGHKLINQYKQITEED